MAFTSLAFMIFAPLFFFTYYAVGERYRRLCLGVASLVFYAYWDVRYVPLLVGSASIDYFCSLRIHRTANLSTRRFWLITALFVNLAILFFFKYWNFFADNLEGATGLEVFTVQVVLPLGISFYTLQTLSYTFDVYRGKIVPETSFATYFLYVSYFPQLVAGPIERAGNLLPQLKNLGLPQQSDIHRGMMLIAWGFFAKLVVADNLSGFIADSFFRTDGGLLLWPISFLAVAQVYCDFLGYTLIARGLAALMGVDLTLNFRQPLFAKNLASFWQRWHISLTRWVMDYVHLPLVRRFPAEPMRSACAIMAMALIGLWHGASWNFVLFGLFHGTALRLWSPIGDTLMRLNPAPAVREIFRRSALVVVACVSAPMFFITDTGQLMSQLASMFSVNPGLEILSQAGYKVEFAVGVGFLLLILFNDRRAISGAAVHMETIFKYPLARRFVFGFLLTSILLFGNFNVRGFIYFAF